jgi:hypothetical protein
VLELQRDFGFHSFSATIYRELAGWLMPIALSTDVGTVLVGALIDEMRERKVLAPALSTIERLAWETRRRAERLVFVRLTAALTDAQRAHLDALLVVQPGARITTLAMLRQPPRRPTPATFMGLAERLQTIRAIGINPEVARKVHPTRLVRPAREGARYSPQFLQRFSPERRYATLVAFLLETSANFTNEAIELHDRLIGQYHTQTRHAHAEQFQQSGRAINEKVRRSIPIKPSRRFCRGRHSSTASPRRNDSRGRPDSILWRCWPPRFHAYAATHQPSWTALSLRGRARVNRCSTG